MLSKGLLKLVCSVVGCIGLLGCSVEAGKIPTAMTVLTPEGELRARTEIKTSLSEIQSSVALIGRVQSVIQKGLEEHDIKTGEIADQPLNLIIPSDADSLTFDKDHPEKFEYRLNNSASVSLKTKSGGHLDIVLTGTLDDLGDHFALRDAKLEVIHERELDRKTFEILVEKKTDQSGVVVTEWLLDFHQLDELYRAISGKDEANLTNMNGVLSVRLSTNEATVTAKDFSMSHKDVRVTFDVVDVNVSNIEGRDGRKPRKVLVSGYADRAQTRLGTFLVSHQSADSVGEFKVEFKF